MRRITVFFLLMICLCSVSHGEEFPKELERQLPFDIGEGQLEDMEQAGTGLWQSVKSSVSEQLVKALTGHVKILFICALCSFGQVIAGAGDNKNGQRLIDMCGVCLVLICVAGDAGSVISQSRRAADDIAVFSKTLLPTFASYAAAAGKPASSAFIAGGGMVYTNLCCSIASNLVFPLIFAYIFMKAVGAFGENPIASGIASAIQKAVNAAVKICIGGVTAYMTLTGAVMSAGDGIAIKAAKAAVSVLPGVGTAVASASESVLSMASVMRNTIGLAGVIAVLFFCAGPFVMLSVNMILFKCVSVAAKAFAPNGVGSVVEAVASSYAMALGILAAVSAGIIMAVCLCVSVFGG